MKKNTIIIIVAVIIVLLIIGWNMGWFGGLGGGKVDSDGFPANPKDGDKYTKDGKVYVFKKMEINCIVAPCPNGQWFIFNSGDSPSMKTNQTQNSVDENQTETTQFRSSPSINKGWYASSITETSYRKITALHGTAPFPNDFTIKKKVRVEISNNLRTATPPVSYDAVIEGKKLGFLVVSIPYDPSFASSTAIVKTVLN